MAQGNAENPETLGGPDLAKLIAQHWLISRNAILDSALKL